LRPQMRRHLRPVGLVFRQGRHPFGTQPTVPHHHQAVRCQRGTHLFQHLDETVDGVGWPAFRPAQIADGVKCPICIGMTINNQQPVHGFCQGNPTTFCTFSTGATFAAGCVGTVFCANGSSSSECTRLPAGSTIVAVTKIIRLFFTVCLLWLWKKRPNNGRSPMTGTLSLVLFTVEVIKPPSTTVWLAQTFTVV